MVTKEETITLSKSQEYKFASIHVAGTHVECTVNAGKGSITIREFGEGKEHFDGPFALSSEIGERYLIELDLDKVEETPDWEVIITGVGEGPNEFLLKVLTINPAQ